MCTRTLADKLQSLDRVTCCFFGDGAVAEGEFHESLNLASLWQVPVLFVCENNRYAMGTALELHQAEPDIAKKLKPLSDVGLGYVKLGQSSDTLSGGEAQRVKLASFLGRGRAQEKILFIFDEPTTGLH